nr:hypothetical protein 21 [Saccharospirillaceae bacterium]
MSVASTLTDLASGGVVGVIGSLASNILGIFKAREDHRQQLDMKKLDAQIDLRQGEQDMKLAQLEAETRMNELQVIKETEESQAEAAAYQASLANAAATGYQGESKLLQFAEFCRKMTRPTLTALLVLFTMVAFFVTADAALKQTILNMLVAATATVIAWWFSDRTLGHAVRQRLWRA